MATTLVGLLALALPRGLAAADLAAEEARVRQAVEEAYGTLERRAKRAGRGLSFELDWFRTFDRTELGALHIADLLTLREGRGIGGGGGFVWETPQGSEPIKRELYYAQWEDMDSWTAWSEAPLADTLTMDELIPLLVEGEPRFHDLLAATSYRVRASLEGETREYLAVVYWFGPPSASGAKELGFSLHDLITLAADDVFRVSSTESTATSSSVNGPSP